jgi:hypothetical protein
LVEKSGPIFLGARFFVRGGSGNGYSVFPADAQQFANNDANL